MPSIEGFDLYEKIKTIDSRPTGCFMTAYDVNYEVFREQFPSLEVECFIPKPAEIGEIIMRVNREILSNSPNIGIGEYYAISQYLMILLSLNF